MFFPVICPLALSAMTSLYGTVGTFTIAMGLGNRKRNHIYNVFHVRIPLNHVERLADSHQNGTYRLCSTNMLEQFISGVSCVQIREDQHIGRRAQPIEGK